MGAAPIKWEDPRGRAADGPPEGGGWASPLAGASWGCGVSIRGPPRGTPAWAVGRSEYTSYLSQGWAGGLGCQWEIQRLTGGR